MTNERAKAVLDFLAKKAGYCMFTIDSSYGDLMNLASVSYSNDGHNRHLFTRDYSANSEYKWTFLCAADEDSYAEILDKIVKITSEGNQIETLNDVFIKSNFSLEQTEIEMDLESYD